MSTLFERELRRIEAKQEQELARLEARHKAELAAFYRRARLMGEPQWVAEARP